MSYTLAYKGAEIDEILGRAATGGALDTAIAAKQDALTFDAVPTEGSTNPAESGGIYDAIQAGGAAALAAFPTDSVSGDVVTISDGADNIPVKSFVGSIIPQQSGSGDPSPSNVRPISGWTEANIKRTGKNLFGGEPLGDAIYAHATGSIDKTAKTVTFTHGDGSKLDFNVKWQPNTQYTFLFTIASYSAQNTSMRVWYTDGTKASISFNNLSVNSVVRFVTAANKTVDGVYLEWFSTGSVGIYYEKSGVFEGSVNTTDLEPYTADTILLSFGQTVYAGTLTALGGGVWKIQPTHGVITYNGAAAESWTYESPSNIFYIRNDNIAKLQDYSTEILCDKLKTVDRNATVQTTNYSISGYRDTGGTYPTRNWIYAKADDTFTSANAFKTWLAANPITVLYPLTDASKPDPITITGEDLQTLLGANTVWTDVGAVTEMEYRADTALYIQKLLNVGGTLQALSTASPSPSLSLGRVGVLAEPEEAEPEQTDEEAEQLEQTEEAEEE